MKRSSFLRLGVLLMSAIWGTATSLQTSSQTSSHRQTDQPMDRQIRRYHPDLDRLLPATAAIEQLASGFEWSEGPVWVKDGGFLLFSDIPRNAVMKWQAQAGVSLFMQPSGYTGVADYGKGAGSNGLLLDGQGRLVLCEHGDRRISRLAWDGGKQTLVDSYQGKRINSPNDAVFHSNGDLYFTDPPYGFPEYLTDPRRELDFCGVYRLSAAGELTLLTAEMTLPNGIAFSPDEKTLYVAQSDPEQAIWKAFPVKADGTLGKSEIFYDVTTEVGRLPGLPDGMKIDREGNIFATGPGGIYVFTPGGTLLGRIELEVAAANCAWGDDGSVLYITADRYLCRLSTSTRGAGW